MSSVVTFNEKTFTSYKKRGLLEVHPLYFILLINSIRVIFESQNNYVRSFYIFNNFRHQNTLTKYIVICIGQITNSKHFTDGYI